MLEGGFVCEGRPYSSLSEIAKVITGTKWNGPRFIPRSITGNLSNKIIQKGLAFLHYLDYRACFRRAFCRSGIPPRRLKGFCGASVVQPGGCT